MENNWIKDDFKSILDKSKELDNQVFLQIKENILNNNYKFKNTKKWTIYTIYMYSVPTSVKSVNEGETNIETTWTVESRFFNFLFRYASAYSNTKWWKVSYIKKLPVFKEKWNFKQKYWNYSDENILKDFIIFSSEKIGFKWIKKEKNSEWNIIVYALKKDLIEKQNDKLKPFVYTIMNMKTLVDEYGKEVINDFLLALASYFITKD